ncbi:unnamed protein product, partial [Amoebophrya sp. A25]|eukprot:GSA25T00007619001.1
MTEGSSWGATADAGSYAAQWPSGSQQSVASVSHRPPTATPPAPPGAVVYTA